MIPSRRGPDKTPPSEALALRCSAQCSGWVFVHDFHDNAPECLAPCPCECLFGSDRQELTWWPRVHALPLATLSPSLTSPLAFFPPAGSQAFESSLHGLCATALALLHQAPHACVQPTVESLYGSLRPELGPCHRRALAKFPELRARWMTRSSPSHELLAAWELRDWLASQRADDHRVVLLLIPRDEFDFLVSSPGRLRLFEDFVLAADRHDRGLVLLADCPLFTSKTEETDGLGARSSYRTAEGRLRFRSTKKTSRVAEGRALEDIVNADIFDRLLGSLERGRQVLASWQRAGGSAGRSPQTLSGSKPRDGQERRSEPLSHAQKRLIP